MGSKPKTTQILLQVQYKPELTIVQEPSKIKAGDNVKITCRAKSNPQQVSFKWYIDDILEYDKVKDEDPGDPTSSTEYHGAVSKRRHSRSTAQLAREQQEVFPDLHHDGDSHHSLHDLRLRPALGQDSLQFLLRSNLQPNLSQAGRGCEAHL